MCLLIVYYEIEVLLCLDQSVWFLCNVIDDWKVWLMDEKWTLNDKVVVLHVSKFYLVYMICISSCLVSLLVRNVITHSLCVVCVWILWWSWTLCSGEQMNRWMTMKNLMLEDTGTQRSDRMWHWGVGFYRRPCLSRSEFIIYLEKFYDDVRKVNVSLLPYWKACI